MKIIQIWQYYAERDVLVAKRAVQDVYRSLSRLLPNPRIGRPFEGDLNVRELVIPFGTYGFLALYRVDDNGDIVVLSIRHQREQTYPAH